MPAKLYRFAWRNNAAYVRTEDAAIVAELGRFLDLKAKLQENAAAGAKETLVTIEEQDEIYYIATSDWQVRAGNRAQLLFAALEAVG